MFTLLDLMEQEAVLGRLRMFALESGDTGAGDVGPCPS